MFFEPTEAYFISYNSSEIGMNETRMLNYIEKSYIKPFVKAYSA